MNRIAAEINQAKTTSWHSDFLNTKVSKEKLLKQNSFSRKAVGFSSKSNRQGTIQ